MNFTAYNSCRPNRADCVEDSDVPHHISQMLNHFKSPKENMTNGSTFQGDQFGCLKGKKHRTARGNLMASDKPFSTSHNPFMHFSVSIDPSIKPIMNLSSKGFSYVRPDPRCITLPLEAERGLYARGIPPIYYYWYPPDHNLCSVFDQTQFALTYDPGNEFLAFCESNSSYSSPEGISFNSNNHFTFKEPHKLNPDAKEYIPKTMRSSQPSEVISKTEDCACNCQPGLVLETMHKISNSVTENKIVGRLPFSEVTPSSSMPYLSDYGFINEENSVCTTTSNESPAFSVDISSNPLHPLDHTELTSSSDPDLAVKSDSANVPLLADNCAQKKEEERNFQVDDVTDTKLEDANDTEDDNSEFSESEDYSEDDGHDCSDVECESDNDDGIYFAEQDEELGSPLMSFENEPLKKCKQNGVGCQSVPNSGQGVISFLLSHGSDSECEEEEEDSENETDYDCDFFKLVPEGEDITFPIGLVVSELLSSTADECESSNAEMSKKLKLINQRWNKNVLKDCCKTTTEKESICDISSKPKRVTFSDNVQIRPIVTYDQDVSSLQWVSDRMRFHNRINETESILNPILNPSHREKVFKLYHNES